MNHIWRLEWYWIAKEATRWTAVDPSVWVKQTDANFEDTVENVQDESALWVLMTTSESERIKQYAEWEIEWILATKSIWYFLLSLLWSVSSAAASAWAYQHDFSMNNTNSKQSLTISKKTPIAWEQFALAMIESLWISASVGEAVMMKAWLRAKAAETATLTKAYVADNTLYAKNVTVKFADTVAWLDAADALCIESVELNLTQELEDGFCFTSWVDLWDIFNKGFSIDWTFTKLKNDTVYQDYVKDWTIKAMRIQIIDTATTIWASDNPTVTIDIAKVTFEDHESDWGLNDIMRENLTFKWHYDLANASDIDIVVINEQSYY